MLDTITTYFLEHTFWEFIVYLVSEFAILRIAIVLLPLVLHVAYLTYVERKVIGFMQVRIGPNRVGPYGLFQPFADMFKLMFKEIIIPEKANKIIFFLGPLMTIAPAFTAWAVIPFDENFMITDVDASLLYVLAMTSLGVYGVIMAGWASNSKYALLGALRSAAQIVSYEIAMGFALVGVLLAAGSLNLREIVFAQEGNIFNWFWLPLFPLYIVYLISGVAETNRAPFDVAEGESEIVAGFHVEYSGMAFAVFFLAEYANMILIAALTALMFLGGWYPPFEFLDFIPGFMWLIFKIYFVLFFFLWFRATFPRYRYDQIMRLGWKVFIPITIIWLLLVAVVVVLDWPLIVLSVPWIGLALVVALLGKSKPEAKQMKEKIIGEPS